MSTLAMAARPTLPDPPYLCPGDHLSRDEFERRYAATPQIRKAELIEGVVYVPSPARLQHHAVPHGIVLTWLGHYAAATPGVQFASEPTVRLDLDNEPQPDAVLHLVQGGRTQVAADDYLEGAPELVVEVTASTASYDLHEKLRAYRRNGVAEYVVWRVLDDAVDWFVLEGSSYRPQAADGVTGSLRSPRFAGLWLHVPALLLRDVATVLRRLDEGLASAEHAAFRARLAGPAP